MRAMRSIRTRIALRCMGDMRGLMPMRAMRSMRLRYDLKNLHLLGEQSNRSKYSMVNHEMQMASMRASFGLSMGSPSGCVGVGAPRCCTDWMVFRVIPTVETTTKAIDITEIT